jgi:23S rRNA (cytidine2498-2'-O)-methyltransferase
MWLFTTRTGSEQDLIDELLMAKVVDPAPRRLAPALVLSPKLPKREGRHIELTFARQGFELQQVVTSHDLDEVASRIGRSFKGQLAGGAQYALHVWVPDSPEGNPLSSLADELDARLERKLTDSLPELARVDDATLRRDASLKLAQVCVADTAHFMAGVMHGNRTPSLAKGGRTRVRLTGDLPSRAARKIEEALSWLGVAPSAGELCVDLGAAPGGWTYVLAERRARVIAVDPAKLRPDILAKKNVRHVQESAFTFAPDEPVDWLFCDMAWRPLEVAALLAKWGRKRWARILVANIKLPMTRKAELLARVRAILEQEGDWRHVRTKQLYHDRDEITLSALRA